jgi:hypothetical protein
MNSTNLLWQIDVVELHEKLAETKLASIVPKK